MSDLSPRLAAIVEGLPLTPASRVLEVGCGPGGAARAVAERVPDGCVLATDRSAKAVAQVLAGAEELVAAGRLGVRQVAVEELELEPGEAAYDVAFVDGREVSP